MAISQNSHFIGRIADIAGGYFPFIAIAIAAYCVFQTHSKLCCCTNLDVCNHPKSDKICAEAIKIDYLRAM